MSELPAAGLNPCMVERGCLLYDVENVGGGTDRATRIRRVLEENGIRLKHVVVAGPPHQVSTASDAFRDCEGLDERVCPHGRQLGRR